MSTRVITLPQEVIDNLKQRLENLSRGDITIEVKAVRVGTYDVVLPVDDLGLQKGETFLAYFLGNKVWLLIPADLLNNKQ